MRKRLRFPNGIPCAERPTSAQPDEVLTLRDRIAGAIRNGDEWISVSSPVAYRLADAVLAELERGEKPCGCRPIWMPDDGPPYCNRCGIPHTTPCRRPEDT